MATSWQKTLQHSISVGCAQELYIQENLKGILEKKHGGFFHHSRRAVLGRRRSHCVDPSTSCLSYANENPQKSLPKRLASTYVQKYITAPRKLQQNLDGKPCLRLSNQKRRFLSAGSTYLLLIRPVTVAKLTLVYAVLGEPGFPYNTYADLEDRLPKKRGFFS